MKKIALIGLGYVSPPLAIEFGKKREVIELEDGIKSMYKWHLKNEV
jgi:UDP-N-acetyl-D-mannosaminuronate dehydrogenase